VNPALPLVRRLQLHILNRQVIAVSTERSVALRRGELSRVRNLEAQKTQLEIARIKLLKGGAL
jgi:hypothetical protein